MSALARLNTKRALPCLNFASVRPYSAEDTSTQASPTITVVRTDLQDDVEGYDTVNSLSNALCRAWTTYTTIYLLDGTHLLSSVSLDQDSNEFTCQSEVSPLSRDSQYKTQYITLKTAFCSEIDIPGCADSSATVELTSDVVVLNTESNTSLYLSSVNFNGAYSLYTDDCNTEEYCTYCPYFKPQGKGYVESDKGELFSQDEVVYASNCQGFNNQSFISVKNGVLAIKAVQMNNFRQQFSNLISCESSFTIESTDFDNCQTFSSMIKGNCRSQGNDICSFSYATGSISRLNNGYEYRADAVQAGFLTLTSYKSVTLSSMTFSKNVIFTSSTSNANLIYITLPDVVSLIDLVFDTNIVIAGLISLDYSELTYDKFDIDSQGYSVQHTQTHVTMTGISITKTYCEVAIKVSYGSQSINASIGLSVNENYFESAALWVEKYDTVTSKDYTISTVTYLEGESKISALTKPYVVTVTGTFTQSISTNGMIYSSKVPTMIINSSSFIDVLNSDVFSVDDSSASYFFGDSDLYLKKTINKTQGSCGSFVSSTLGYALAITQSTWTNLYCNNGSPGINLTNISGSVTLTNLTFKNLSSGVKSVAAVKGNGNNGSVTITSNSFTNLTVTAISLITQGVLVVKQSTFENITTGDTVCINSSIGTSIQLSQLTFNSISSEYTVLVKVENTGDYMEYIASSLTFTNINSNSVCTCLLVSGSIINVNWSTITFDGVKGVQNSLIYFFTGTILTDTSTITGLTAKNIEETSAESITLYLEGGHLAISDSSFTSMKINIVFKSILSGTSKFSLVRCTISGITASSLLFLSESAVTSLVSTSSCNFANNAAKAINISIARWSDSSSTFKSNSKGGVFAISGNIELQGTKFLSNTSEDDGGAIQLAYKCTLKCTSCSFDANSAVSGGAVRIDQSSVLEISSSTFTNNKSSQGGSAIYMISSKKANTIDSSTFKANKTQTSGTILIIESYLTMTNTKLSENYVSQTGGGFQLNSATLTCTKCEFENMTAYYASFLHIMTKSTVKMTGSTFVKGSGYTNGGAVLVSDSDVEFDDCTGSNISTQARGGFLNMEGQR